MLILRFDISYIIYYVFFLCILIVSVYQFTYIFYIQHPLPYQLSKVGKVGKEW